MTGLCATNGQCHAASSIDCTKYRYASRVWVILTVLLCGPVKTLQTHTAMPMQHCGLPFMVTFVCWWSLKYISVIVFSISWPEAAAMFLQFDTQAADRDCVQA